MINNCLILYWSKTGNTKKVAFSIKNALEEKNVEVKIHKIDNDNNINLFDYDLVCLGSPSHFWNPPSNVRNFIKDKYYYYKKKGYVQLKAPKKENKNAIVFCTYSGPHTGKNEAVPVVKYISQFFEHLGFNVLKEFYIVGEYHSSINASTNGKLGDIRGYPTEEHLSEIKNNIKKIIHTFND